MATPFYQSSDEVIEKHCGPCKIGDEIQIDAAFYCHECKESLCTECKSHHKKLSITRTHQVSTIDEYNQTVSGLRGHMMAKGLKQIDIGARNRHTPIQIQKTTTTKSFTKATLSYQFNSSLDDDTELPLNTGVLITTELIYITDSFNGRVKIFDNQGQHISSIQMFDVRGVVEIDEDKIAVTNCSKTISIFNRNGPAFTASGQINTSIDIWAIGFFNNHLYAVCREKGETLQIQVLTLEGKIKRRIEPISQGSPVLQNPGNIAVNKQTGHIYVSDWEKGIIALNPTGKLEFVDQLFSETETATSVAIDDHGDVYVCGVYTDNVMQMSADRRKKLEILRNSQECRYPQCIAIHGNTMILCCRDTDVVRIYTLS